MTQLNLSIRVGVRLVIAIAVCGVGAVFVNAFALVYYSSPVFQCGWGSPRDVAFRVTGGASVYTSLVDGYRALVPREAPAAAAAAAADAAPRVGAAAMASLNVLRHSLKWVLAVRKIWSGAEKPTMEMHFRVHVTNNAKREFKLKGMQVEVTAGYEPLQPARPAKDGLGSLLAAVQRFVARGMTQAVQRVMLIDVDGFNIPADSESDVDMRVTLTLVSSVGGGGGPAARG